MKKLLLLLLALCCLAAVGCQKTDPAEDSAGTGTGAPVTVPPVTTPLDTEEPDEPDVPEIPAAEPNSVVVGKIRVQLLSDRLVRVEYEGPKGFEDRPSFTVLNRTEWVDVPYTVTETETDTRIATEFYTVSVPNEMGYSLKGIAILSADGTETIWEYQTATHADMFLPSPSDALQSWAFTDSPRVIPSENGYSLTETYEELNGWDLDNDAEDMFVFLPQGNYKNFTTDFVKLTGSSEMVTLGMLGYWDSRYYEYTAETALQQIKDYQDRGYSIDVLVIDTDWRASGAVGGIGYDINTDLFPDMADFLAKAHELGVKVMFNDHPEPAAGTDNLLDQEEIEYRSNHLKLILSMGLDIWWYDRNWDVALNPIHDGMSRYTTGMYAFQWITQDYYESITDVGEYARRALIMANVDGIFNGDLRYAPDLASHRYSIQWTGDIYGTSDSLEEEIFNAIYSGAKLGLPYISCDLGGHWTEVSDIQYIRWLQYGALSPICRVHCCHPYSRMPWLYGETAEDVVHTYVDLRYRLLPLYYSLAHENYMTGLPLVRRVDISYPQYAESSANDEYLLGDSVLVAPVTEGYNTVLDLQFSSNGHTGLLGEYYENTNLEGDPAFTQYDESLYFKYEAPEGLSVIDNFSMRWTGEITVGEDEIALQFLANLGLRVWIDGELVYDDWGVSKYNTFTSELLAAGSTHSLKIEFFDTKSDATLYVFGYKDGGATRDVFLPDGEWMNVWTGETYAGPTTVSVFSPLTQSPLFVRLGSIVPLADVCENADETDWSHLTLDVYPSTSNDASYTLYEDDATTVAYKDGHYRTTDMTLSETAENQLTLKIAAAKGEFTGELACDTREWTVRVHGREGWGALTGVTLDGNAVEFTVLERNPDAEPLTNEGGARDGVVYEITFTASVTEKSRLVLTFADTAEDKTNESYDKTAANFTVTVNKVNKSTAAFNATERGTLDWVVFAGGENGSPVRKAGVSPLIGELTCETPRLFYYSDSSNFEISWSDGDAVQEGSSESRRETTAGFRLTLKASTTPVTYKIYVCASQTISDFTVRDRAGNIQTVNISNINANIYREVEITCSAETDTELYVTYSGGGTSISAATAAAAE